MEKHIQRCHKKKNQDVVQVKYSGQMRQDLNGVTLTLEKINLNIEIQ